MSNKDWHDSSDPSESKGDPWDEYADKASGETAGGRWDQWTQLGYDTPAGQGSLASKPHSGLGIASLILTVFAGVGTLATVLAATMLVAGNPNIAEDNPQIIAAGCGIISSLLVAALGGVLGLIALFQPDRNKLFAILGCVLAALQLVGVGALIVIGTMFG